MFSCSAGVSWSRRLMVDGALVKWKQCYKKLVTVKAILQRIKRKWKSHLFGQLQRPALDLHNVNCHRNVFSLLVPHIVDWGKIESRQNNTNRKVILTIVGLARVLNIICLGDLQDTLDFRGHIDLTLAHIDFHMHFVQTIRGPCALIVRHNSRNVASIDTRKYGTRTSWKVRSGTDWYALILTWLTISVWGKCPRHCKWLWRFRPRYFPHPNQTPFPALQ